MIKSVSCLLLGVLAVAPARAETVVIEAASYLDVVEGKLVSPAILVVEGDRIAAINPAERPAGARVLSLRGHTVLPGLMDSHVHLNYELAEGWETEPVRFTTGDFALRAAAEETHRHGLKIAAQAHGTEGIIAASEAGIDSIDHNSIMTEEAAQILRKNGSFVVPNLHLLDTLETTELPPALAAKQAYLKPLAAESFRRSLKYGLKVSFGTDAGVFPHGDNAREFVARVRHGDTPLHAIRSATVVNAGLFGTPDRGRIETGLLADLIAVKGNPLEDVRLLEDVRFVMKGGVVFKQPD